MLCKFQIIPYGIHGEIPQNPLSELCEKMNSLNNMEYTQGPSETGVCVDE